MAKEKILVVEDDSRISQLVKYNLEKAGYQCLGASSGEEALDLLGKNATDLIILDIMLPKMDGFDVCKKIKQDDKLADVPIIMLTAKGEEVDRVVGFELGADDYVVKPFSTRELILRVKAIMNRKAPKRPAGDILKAGGLRIDIPRHKVTVDGEDVVLTLLEFKLLVTLVRRRGRVQSREKLLNDVWDISTEVTTRTIDTHIKRLRQKLGTAGELVETIRGIGYRFKEEG